jgi:ADP-heptose:LPS heptosyltransferase
LGDFLTGLPAIGLLKGVLPRHELILAAPPVFGPIIPLVPAIDRLAPIGELMPLDPIYRCIEVAVDLHGKGPESRRLLAELCPAQLVGFADPAAGLSGPTWVWGEHEVTRWCRLVRESFDPVAEMPSVAGTVQVPPTDTTAGLTIVHPGAASGSRRWPAQRFAQVASELRRQGHRVVITGGHAEEALARGIAAASGAAAMLDLSLTELLAVVASARLVVCGDTGIAHIASNYRTPSVVLFGPVSPASWGPPPDPRHAALFHGDGQGDPHGDETDSALLEITVQEVLESAGQVTRGDPT